MSRSGHSEHTIGPLSGAKAAADMDLTFGELQQACRERTAIWQPNGVSLEYRGLELGGESGEAQNAIKKLCRLRLGIVGGLDTTELIAEELADTIMSCQAIANDLGIDLPQTIRDKFNKTSREKFIPVYL